jgi:hypothetical protein
MSHELIVTHGHSNDGHSGDITRAVPTKDHNSDLPISLTSLVKSRTGLNKYLLISSTLRLLLPRIDLTNI